MTWQEQLQTLRTNIRNQIDSISDKSYGGIEQDRYLFAEVLGNIEIALGNISGGGGGGGGSIDYVDLAQAIEDALADPGIVIRPESKDAMAVAIKAALEAPGVVVSTGTINAIATALKTALETPGVVLGTATIDAIAAAINTEIATPGITLRTETINAIAPTTELNKNTFTTNTAATVAAGAFHVSVENIGDANGSVDGLAIEPNEIYDYPPIGLRPYTQFDIDGTGTTLKVMEIR